MWQSYITTEQDRYTKGMTMTVSIRIKPGLVDRLRETRGLYSDDAVARLIRSDRTTLRRIVRGAQPSGAFIAGFCEAFGLGLGEAFEIVHDAPTSTAKAEAAERAGSLAA